MNAPTASDHMALCLCAVALFAQRRFLAATPRSTAYRRGFETRLAWYVKGRPKGISASIPPYPIGTAEADAWWAGCDAADNPIVLEQLDSYIDTTMREQAIASSAQQGA